MKFKVFPFPPLSYREKKEINFHMSIFKTLLVSDNHLKKTLSIPKAVIKHNMQLERLSAISVSHRHYEKFYLFQSKKFNSYIVASIKCFNSYFQNIQNSFKNGLDERFTDIPQNSDYLYRYLECLTVLPKQKNLELIKKSIPILNGFNFDKCTNDIQRLNNLFENSIPEDIWVAIQK